MKGWFRLSPAKFLAQIDRQIRQEPRIRTVLLSAENFAGEPGPWRFATSDEYVQAQSRKIAQLHRLLGGRSARIVVYLRRQDCWINSGINHVIKTEGLVGQRIFDSVDQYLELFRPRLDYHAVLTKWAETFGAENISVAPYEKAQLKNRDLFDDFLDRVGISSSKGFARPPQTVDNENVGLSRDALEVKIILNRIPKKKHEEQLIIQALQEISHEMGDSGQKGVNFLSPRDCFELMHRVEASNEAVAKEFLDRKDGRLFQEPVSDPNEPWEPYPGLSTEVALEIMLRLRRKPASLRYRINRLRFVLNRWTLHHALWLRTILRPIYRAIFR